MKRIGLLLTALIVCCAWAGAQDEETEGTGLRASNAGMEITDVFVFGSMEYISDYQGNVLLYIKTPYYNNTGKLMNPFEIRIDKTITTPVKVKYSLYAFKPEFLNDVGAHARRSVFRYVVLKASVYACSKLSFVNKGTKCRVEGNENTGCILLINRAIALLLTRRSGTLRRAGGHF